MQVFREKNPEKIIPVRKESREPHPLPSAVLSETLGNPKARCVYDVSREKQGVRRLIVIHNPATRAFCVLRLSDDGKNAEIVSWHRENPRYGNRQWSKN